MHYWEAELSGIGEWDGKRIALRSPTERCFIPVSVEHGYQLADDVVNGTGALPDGSAYRMIEFHLHHINSDGIRVYRECRKST